MKMRSRSGRPAQAPEAAERGLQVEVSLLAGREVTDGRRVLAAD